MGEAEDRAAEAQRVLRSKFIANGAIDDAIVETYEREHPPWTPGPRTFELVENNRHELIIEMDEIYGPAVLHDRQTVAAVDLDADARLITLAPEMAELLAIMVEHANGNPDWPYVERARALLSRARGET